MIDLHAISCPHLKASNVKGQKKTLWNLVHKTKQILFLLLILMFLGPQQWAQAQARNPFLNPEQNKPQTKKPAQNPRGAQDADQNKKKNQNPKTVYNSKPNQTSMFSLPPLISNAYGQLKNWLRVLNEKIAGLTDQISQGSAQALFLLFLVAFVYGIVHAIGPGHGKSIAMSYFINQKSHWSRGVSLGFLIAGIHTLSAIIVVSVLFFIVKSALLMTMDKASYYVQLISYSLIVLIGLYLIWHTVHEKKSNVQNINARNETHENDQRIPLRQDKSLVSIALAIGLIPCPGASLILLFSYNLNLYAAGIAAVVFMSVGMALTISMFSLAAIFFHNSLAIVAAKRKWMNHIFFTVELLAAMLIILLGAVLFGTTI